MAVWLACSDAWDLLITEENTFITVKLPEDEEVKTQRSRSLPAVRSSFAEKKKVLRCFMRDILQSEQPSEQGSPLTGALVGPNGPQTHLPCSPDSSSFTGTQSGQLDESECETPASRTNGKMQHHGPRKRRPCKGTRARIHRLLERLTLLMDENPEEFDIQAVHLPVCVGDHEELRKKVFKAVQAHYEAYYQKAATIPTSAS